MPPFPQYRNEQNKSFGRIAIELLHTLHGHTVTCGIRWTFQPEKTSWQEVTCCPESGTSYRTEYQGHLRCDLLLKLSFLHCAVPSDSPAFEDATPGPGHWRVRPKAVCFDPPWRPVQYLTPGDISKTVLFGSGMPGIRSLPRSIWLG